MKFRVYKIFWESCIISIYGNYCAVCQIDVPCKEYLCGWFFWENSEFIELKYIKSTVDWCPVLYKSGKNWARHKACKTAILIKICPNVLKIMSTLHWATGTVRLLVESFYSPSGVQPESNQSPPGVQPESTRSPTEVHQESNRSPSGVHLESNRSPSGVHTESIKSPWRLHQKSNQSPPGVYKESNWSPRKIHQESIRSPPGVHLEFT